MTLPQFLPKAGSRVQGSIPNPTRAFLWSQERQTLTAFKGDFQFSESALQLSRAWWPFLQGGCGKQRNNTWVLYPQSVALKATDEGEIRLYEPFLLMCLHLPDRTVRSPGSITDPLKDLVHHVWIWLSLLSGCSLTNSQHYIAERNLQTHSPIHHSPPVHTARTTGCHYILMLPRRKIESLHRKKLLEAGMDVGLSIFIRLISVYCRNKYARDMEASWSSHTSWSLGYNRPRKMCVCAHNEIYNLLQISCLGVHSKCLLP